MAQSGAVRPPAIRILLEGLRADRLSVPVRQVNGTCRLELLEGVVLTFPEKSIRLRRLPLACLSR